MITILFFSRYREALNCGQTSLEWQPQWQSLADVRQSLVQRGASWTVLEDPGLMCARNEELCPLSSPVQPGDVLAFFPTVTGG